MSLLDTSLSDVDSGSIFSNSSDSFFSNGSWDDYVFHLCLSSAALAARADRVSGHRMDWFLHVQISLPVHQCPFVEQAAPNLLLSLPPPLGLVFIYLFFHGLLSFWVQWSMPPTPKDSLLHAITLAAASAIASPHSSSDGSTSPHLCCVGILLHAAQKTLCKSVIIEVILGREKEQVDSFYFVTTAAATFAVNEGAGKPSWTSWTCRVFMNKMNVSWRSWTLHETNKTVSIHVISRNWWWQLYFCVNVNAAG